MEKNIFAKIKRNNLIKIFRYLTIIDLIRMKNVNKQTKEIFINSIDTVKIYKYVIKYNSKWSNNNKSSNKIRILNLMTDSEFMFKVEKLYKIDKEKILIICRELLDYYYADELKILKMIEEELMNNK